MFRSVNRSVVTMLVMNVGKVRMAVVSRFVVMLMGVRLDWLQRTTSGKHSQAHFGKRPRSAQDDTVRATYGIKLRTKQSMPCGVGTHFSVSTLIRQAFGRASLEELPSRVQGARVAYQDPW